VLDSVVRVSAHTESIGNGRQAILDALAAVWGEWYQTWWEAGQYVARRRDDGAICRRGAASDLEREMAADLVAHPLALP
jgi:hypothetical protein